MLRIADTRCVHQRAAQASCEHCVRICPRVAWRHTPEGLSFDEDLCDGCGLCVTACPTSALALPESAAPAPAPGRREVVTLVCDAAAEGRPVAGGLRRPCAHAVDELELLQWHRAGTRRVEVRIGECRTCRRGRALAPEDRLQERLTVVNRVLQARRLPPLLLNASVVPAAAAPEPLPPAPDHRPQAPARRSFLGLSRTSAPEPIPLPWPTRRPSAHRLVRALGPGPALWAVHLHASRCDACGACARLCPTSAFTLIDLHPTERALRLDLSACVGCDLCIDVCAPGAIESVPMGSAPMSMNQIKMTLVKCSCCGKSYAGVATHQRHDRCPACRGPAARSTDRRVQSTPSSQ